MKSCRTIGRGIALSLAGAAFLLTVSRTAYADTVTLFSNFGTGTTFEPASYFFGFTPKNDEDVPAGHATTAFAFESTSDAALESVTLALRFEHLIGPGTLQASLYGSDGRLPGALLERFSRTSPYVADAPLSFESACIRPCSRDTPTG